MNLYAASALINLLTSLVLGLLILSADKRSMANRMFAAFAAAVAFWSYAYFSWQISDDPGDALFWVHLLMAGAIVITPIYFHFSLIFLGEDKDHRVLIGSGYVFLIVFSALNWAGDSYIAGVRSIAGFPFWPEAGAFFLPFLLVWITYALLPVFFLLRALKSPDPRRASAIRYILAGTLIGYAGGCTNYFLWYGIHILPWGNISTSIYLGLVAYAIMRYQLFNMKMIATELLVFSLWLIEFSRLLTAATMRDQLIEAGVLALLLVIGVFLIRSVDREVEHRELIQKQAHDLEVANAQQISLLHFISHEVKGSLNKAQGVFAGMVEGDYGDMDGKLREIAASALHEVKAGIAMVMDILDASNLKKGTMSFEREPFDVRAAIERTVDNARPMAREKGLHLELVMPPAGTLKIEGDEAKLSKHVFRNLVENAIHYTPHGFVRVSLSRIGAIVRFSVEDSGVGITPDDMAHLFTEGGRGKDSLKVNVNSTGYGLFIAKSVVDAHRGTIRAESAGPGKGSRFIVELPA